jgi:hypothetical protein
MSDTFELKTQNPYSNAGQATVSGFSNNMSYKPTVEELNRTITSIAFESTPFDAIHPAVAGRRNSPRVTDEESIALGPIQEIGPRLHASGQPILRAKKK